MLMECGQKVLFFFEIVAFVVENVLETFVIKNYFLNINERSKHLNNTVPTVTKLN